jgi:hypothetical protein
LGWKRFRVPGSEVQRFLYSVSVCGRCFISLIGLIGSRGYESNQPIQPMKRIKQVFVP